VVSIFLGENNRDYIARLQTLEPAILGPIMHMIMAKQEECKRLAASTDVDELIDQVLQTRDVDLAHEEEHASILLELETSRKQGSDLLSRLEHLQRNYDELVQEHNRQQDELAELRRSGSDSEFTSQRDKQRIREQEDVIASQEGEIQGYNETIRGLKVQIREYEKRVQKMDDLNDQVTELRHTNTELSKKANAAERYKQKLEAQQSLVTENSNLIFEKASLQKDHDDAVAKISALEESLRKYKTREDSRTHAISEVSREVEDLRVELLKKDQELATLKALRENDERVIYELQDQLKNGHSTPMTGALASASFQDSLSSLEAELNGADDDVPPPPPAVVAAPPPPSATATLEISRLRAEIAILKSDTASSDEFKRLRDERDSMSAQVEALRRERLDSLEKQAYRENLIRDVLAKSGAEGLVHADLLEMYTANALDSSLDEIDTKFAVARAAAEGKKKQLEDLQARLGDVERQLVVANASLEAVAQSELDAIEIIKQAEFTVSTSLRAELDTNRQERMRLQADLIQCQADLVAAYQSKDQIRKELDEIRESQDKTLIASDEESPDSAKTLGEKLDKMRSRLKQRTEVGSVHCRPAHGMLTTPPQLLEKTQQELFDLQRKNKQLLTEGGPQGAQRVGRLVLPEYEMAMKKLSLDKIPIQAPALLQIMYLVVMWVAAM
jgi:protein HOOK3